MKKVAVYGSLRSGLHNNSILGTEGVDSKYLGSDRVSGYHLFAPGHDCFPYAVAMGGAQDLMTVEIYEVTDEVFKNLDCLEGYPHHYSRSIEQTIHGNAWVYHLPHHKLPGSDWKRVRWGDWKSYLQNLKKYRRA